MTKDEEIIRISTKALPAPGTIISGTLGDEVQTIRRSTPASGGVALSGDLEVVRLRIAASGSVAISGDLKNVSNKIPASGGVAKSGDTPVLTWRQKVHPASGGGVNASANPTAETWGAFVNVTAPAQNFEVVKIEAHIKQKSNTYFEYGKSGQSDTDISHLSVQESGTVLIDTLNPAHRYNSGDDLSVRTKTQKGSGIESTIWIFTREPT